MKKVVFICQPTRIYSDWVEGWLAGNRLGMLSKIYNFFNLYGMAYYKANPRTVEYCLRGALDYSESHLDKGWELHLIVQSEDFNEEVDSGFKSVKILKNREEFIAGVRTAITDAEKVILLYPDSIGHGYKHTESILKNREGVYVLNGRKRLFELSPATLKRLGVRRVLEKFFVLEAITSLLFPVLFVPYCIYEFVTRKRYQMVRKKSSPAKVDSERFSDGQEEKVKIGEIAAYWSVRPQTYGTEDGKPQYVDERGRTTVLSLGNKEFFDKVDSTFYSWNKPLHIEKNGKQVPFAKIFDYESLRGEKVLEVGCGMGTMAMNWAKQGAEVFAIDVNLDAVELTRKRFGLSNLGGNICLGDARRLPFKDNVFGYAYSWGVLHHSPNIKGSVQELYRVLRPGAKVGIMVYNRRSILFRYLVEYLEGFLHFERNFLSLLELSSRYADGGREEGNPYTYPLTKHEVINGVMRGFNNIRVQLFGTDIEWMLSFLCVPYHRMVPLNVRKSLARRFGWSIWIEAEKPLQCQGVKGKGQDYRCV